MQTDDLIDNVKAEHQNRSFKIDYINFDEIADILAAQEDALTKRFLKSLLDWKTNPN